MKKPESIQQRDRSDCGAACLASVSAHFGLFIPVSSVRLYAGTNRSGTSINGLMKAAHCLHFHSRAVKVPEMTLAEIPLPAIFHLVNKNGLQHFVVVYRVNKNRVLFMDPAFGKFIEESLTEFKIKWKGIVLLLHPLEKFTPGNQRKSAWYRFWQLIKPHRSLFLVALSGAVLYTMLGLTTSIYVQKTIDSVLPARNRSLMNLLSLGMIGILTFQIVMGYLKSLIALRTGQQIDSQLILGYYSHLLQLPRRFFDNMQTGEIISRVSDAVRIRTFINDIALNLVVQALTVLLSLTGMFFYSAKLAMLVLASIPLYLIIFWISNQINVRWQRQIMQNAANVESQLVESIQGITTVRRFGTEDFFYHQTESRFKNLQDSIYKSSLSGLRVSNITEWITGLIKIIILWVGTFLVLDRQLSAGEIFSFFTLTAFFVLPVQVLIGANKCIQEALIAADRLFEIIDLETEKELRESPVETPYFMPGNLHFKNVFFSYETGNRVFEGLDLQIPQNRITAIVGESGSGKSTLLSLLLGFYSPDDGNIFLGETDIRSISLSLLRKHIASVPQQTDLFQGSVISNIALGEINPELDRIHHICGLLGLDDFIDKLPDRYETVIREQGMNLSGGQKQRISIARALYRDPDILILDEATSALDPESERKVQEAIRWFNRKNKTVIVIAHRLSTVLHCESVAYLKKGKCVASGKHEQLMLAHIEYAKLWEAGI